MHTANNTLRSHVFQGRWQGIPLLRPHIVVSCSSRHGVLFFIVSYKDLNAENLDWLQMRDGIVKVV